MWLVTGSTGFLGRMLVKHLLRYGSPSTHDVVLLVRNRKKHQRVLPELQGRAAKSNKLQCHVVEGDLFNLENLKPYYPHIKGVLHLAGLVFAHTHAEFKRTNERGTQHLHEAFHKHGKIEDLRWLQVSSLAANGPISLSEKTRDPYVDQDKPISWYGNSKLAADHYLRLHHPKEKLVVIRPPAVFGEVDAAWLPFLKMIKKGYMPSWRGSVMPYFSMIDERSLVATLWALMNTQQSYSHSIYPTFEEPVHWNQMMEIWKASLGLGHKKMINIPVYPWGVKMAAKTLDVASRWKPLAKKLKVSSDKLREMMAFHWVKDGAQQLAELEIQVPKYGVDAWHRCVQHWKDIGWI